MNLDPFFKSKRIAIIGASRENGKIGNVILRQLLGKNFTLFAVNPSADEILGIKSYPSVLDVPGTIELAVIATPAQTVPAILDQLGKKKVHHAVIITAGFKETGNTKLERDLQDKLKSHKILAIGPNCLGVLDCHTGLDTLFLPSDRLKRPKPGHISFVSQSGATGSAILDLLAGEDFGFAKFISYGNAANVSESDLISYLDKDPYTKVIAIYLEGAQNGRAFLDASRTCKKPIVLIKGGTTSFGSSAAKSHTGSLAGSADVYLGAFKQAGIIYTQTTQELFDTIKIFDKLHVGCAGNRVQIITNGGGYGILAADAVFRAGLTLAPAGAALKSLKKHMPTAILSNPLDLLGDADDERYCLALDAAISDPNSDAIVCIALPQTPRLDQNLIKIIAAAYQKSSKPFVLVTTGSTAAKHFKTRAEAAGIPCYDYPENAVDALKRYIEFCRKH
ncbi:CoA-binding protein [Candidatus Woesearchaeota archaeon]|nr:MAG: CoA-binding protein [Candidatus Woesearchaeota archaeon]